jgi:hypothetical protein
MTLLIFKSAQLLSIIVSVSIISAWSPQLFSMKNRSHQQTSSVQFSGAPSSDNDDDNNNNNNNSRRRFLNVAAMNVCLMGAAATVPAVAFAADSTKYISGKTPQLPGVEVKKKADGDKKGTRKDPNFLRSISDCKSKCQLTPGSDGYSRSKEDCLSECQDICCTTYEQCSFNIVPRL